MLPAFKLGGGGRLGDGDQFVPWIALDDQLRATYRLLGDDTMSGPYNLVAPRPVTSRTLAKTLGDVLNRPADPARPRRRRSASPSARWPKRPCSPLNASSPAACSRPTLDFRFPDLEPALRWMLGRPKGE